LTSFLKQAEDLFYKGISKLKERDFLSAKIFFLKAYDNYPERVSILQNLSITFSLLEDFENSIFYAKKFLLLSQDKLDATNLLINVFANLRRINDGIFFFQTEKSLEEKEKIWGLANLYFLNNDYLNSELRINTLIQNYENFYYSYYLLAFINIYKNLNSKAIISLKKVIKLNPKFSDAYFLLGKIYKKLGNIKKAQHFFGHAIDLDSNNFKLIIENALLLPVINQNNSELSFFRKNYFNNLEKLNNKNLSIYDLDDSFPDNQSFFLSYNNENNKDILERKFITYKKIFPILNQVNIIKNLKNSKIKIGFISEFFTDHTIGKLFSELILNLDKKYFEIIIFHSHLTKDGNIKKKLDINIKRVITLSKNFQNNINKIREEYLDILFYTDIGMSSDLYYLTFLKLAKFQITSWGHPETTGNPNIDFFVSNKLSEVADSANYYSEKLELFNQFNVYCSPPTFEKKKFNFNYSSDFKFYSCPQSLFKILPDFDIVISKILNEDKKAIIFFIKDNFNYWFRLLKIRFQKNISKDHLNRVIFLNRLSTENFINLCGSSNVLLDPLYFGAGNSFIETLTYGTPYITFPGKFLRSRIALGIYKQMNILNGPIATSLENYAELAVEFANNKLRNDELRNNIIRNSKKFFFNNQKVLQEYEVFFKRVVN